MAMNTQVGMNFMHYISYVLIFCLGPSSGISLISDPGMDWIANTFEGSNEICMLLKCVTKDIALHLQMPKCMPINPWAAESRYLCQKSLPTEETIWKYVQGKSPAITLTRFRLLIII
jgi:hypothetical protein